LKTQLQAATFINNHPFLVVSTSIEKFNVSNSINRTPFSLRST